MNINDIETLVLLRQSGEIAPADLTRLNDALAADPAAATHARRLDRLAGLARTPADETALPAFVRERILHEARSLARAGEHAERRAHRWSFGVRLAAAATVALLLGLPVVFLGVSKTAAPVLVNVTVAPTPVPLDDGQLAAIVDDGLAADVDALHLNLTAGLPAGDDLALATADEDELLNQLASSLLLEQM
jgi:anti-sigma factor RsiW